MYRAGKSRKIVIGSLLCLLLIMSVGYAVFQSRLEIKGSSKITSNWDVRITNVTQGTVTGDAENASAPTWTDLTANMEANLYEKGAKIEYDVTISNRGTFDAKLDNIVTTPSSNEAVIITFSGYTKGEKLAKGQDKIIHVTIEYNPDYNGTAEVSGTSVVEFNYVQDEGYPLDPVPERYLLTYNYGENGGTSTNAENEYIDEGTVVNLQDKVAVKPGYTFIGWNTDKDAHTGLQTTTMTADTTLYAMFSKRLIVTFDNDNHDACLIYNNETSCSVTLPNRTRENYIFDGWYTDSEFTTKAGNYNDSYAITNDITLYSKFVSSVPICNPVVTSATIDTVIINSNCQDAQSITNYSYKINNGNAVNSANPTYTFDDFSLSTIEIIATNIYGNSETFTLSDENLQAGYEIIYDILNEEYNDTLEQKEAYENEILDKTYPVGSIYISTSNTNPGSIFGGTWIAYAQGRTLVGVGNNGTTNYSTVEQAGGTETVTLATINLPKHSHTVTPTGTISSTFTGTKDMKTSENGGHTHDFSNFIKEGNAKEVTKTVGLVSGKTGFQNRVLVSSSSSLVSTSTAGAHTHSYTAKGSVTSSFSGSETTSTSIGSNSSFNIMNPYLTTYIWKRTA